MSSVVKQEYGGSTPPITGKSSIPEVVDFILTAFQPKHHKLGVQVLQDRENALKSEIERLKKLRTQNEDLKKLRRENEDLVESNNKLKREVEELKAEKKEIEEKLEVSEMRFSELDERLVRMEEDFAVLAGVKVSEIGDLADNVDDLQIGAQTHLQSIVATLDSSSPKKEEGSQVVVLSDDEGEMPTGIAGVLEQNEMEPCRQMNEEKGESSQGKRSIGSDDGDGSSVHRKKLKCVNELSHETAVTPVFNCQTKPSSSGAGTPCAVPTNESIARAKSEANVTPSGGKFTASDIDVKPRIAKGSRKWKLEYEMQMAFENDVELCLSAVCALFRKLISTPFYVKPVDMEDQDYIVGFATAEYLINGHPEKKLNKLMSEVSKRAIVESKRLALKYSKKLFEIYRSGEDPLFSESSLSSNL